jgi:hypothetical protein
MTPRSTKSFIALRFEPITLPPTRSCPRPGAASRRARVISGSCQQVLPGGSLLLLPLLPVPPPLVASLEEPAMPTGVGPSSLESGATLLPAPPFEALDMFTAALVLLGLGSGSSAPLAPSSSCGAGGSSGAF